MLNIFERIVGEPFRKSFYLFTKRQRTKLIVLGVIQIALGLMDLLAVGLLAILGKLAVTGVQSRQSTGNIFRFLKYLGIEHFDIQKQAIALGTIALLLLCIRSATSILLVQKSLKAISIASSEISSNLISQVFSRNRIQSVGYEPHEVLFSLTQGVTLVTIGIVGTFVTIIGDLGLIILMFAGILFVDPLIAIISILIFGITTFLLSRYLHNRAVKLGSETANLNVQSNRIILETVQLHTDLYVRNRIGVFTGEISRIRENLMDTNRQLVFLPNISKYIFETTVLFGAFMLAGVEFYLNDAPTAVSALTLFMASGSRVVPALVRSQQGLMSIKTNLASSGQALHLISIFSRSEHRIERNGPLETAHEGFEPYLEVRNGNFTFPSNSQFSIRNINLKISVGEFIAFVGKSGAGKSTLIDLLLGSNDLDTGEIEISGLTPQQAVKNWTGAIGYVPQNVKLIEATLRENILLGFSGEDVDDKTLIELLGSLGLGQLISRQDGLDTQISQFAGGLSGGQIQRIGLARALITNPALLFLDEATSSLDAETENIVSALLRKLHGKVTIIVVAHRLSTVQNADCLYWMEDGEIVSSGSFDNLRKQNQNFEASVNLLGL